MKSRLSRLPLRFRQLLRGFPVALAALVLGAVVHSPIHASEAASSDWPQWRGPGLDGSSLETGLPVSWGVKENVVWKTSMPGVSGATPIISGDRIFLNVALEKDLELWALDRKTGDVLWKRSLGGGNYTRMKHNMSSPSPVTDGDLVWVMSGTGLVKAFDFDGTEKWARNLPEEYGAFGLNHGYGASPLLDEGKLFIPVLHGMKTDDPSYVIALDGATGETVWKVERVTEAIKESPDSYSTPMIARWGGRSELLITGADYVTGHSLDDGQELWRVGGLNPKNSPMYRIVASPVVAGNTVLVPSRVSPLLALRVSEKKPVVAWSLDKATDVPTPVVYKGLVFVLTDKGLVSAYQLSNGQALFENKRVTAGNYSASPLLAEGRLYLTSEDGVTTVIKAGPEFEVLSENRLEGYTLSSIAAAQSQLFVRTADYLYCLDQ